MSFSIWLLWLLDFSIRKYYTGAHSEHLYEFKVTSFVSVIKENLNFEEITGTIILVTKTMN